jgi:chromosome segregation ATPase
MTSASAWSSALPKLRREVGSARSEVGSLRQELHSEIGSARKELGAEIGSVREELHTEIGSVRQELVAINGQLHSMQRTMIQFQGVLIAALIGTLATLIATQI